MSGEIDRLIAIMAALRTPKIGCPWDLEQDFRSIAPYTIEEAYEVVDAIERGDLDDLRDELGDLLLQVVFHARLAEESGVFSFTEIVKSICDKLVRRHPHVFGEGSKLTSDDVALQWEAIKAQEKKQRKNAETYGLLEGVPLPLPALTRAVKLQKKASTVGFDWNDASQVLAKIREETEEVAAELQSPGAEATPALAEEIGDLLFVIANLARHAKVDPEQALRSANAKFERRFRHIENELVGRGVTLAASTLEEMEALWIDAKMKEKKSQE